MRTMSIRGNEKITCYVTVRVQKAIDLCESYLKLKEYEILRWNFSDTCFRTCITRGKVLIR